MLLSGVCGLKERAEKSDLMVLNCVDYLVDTMKGNLTRHFIDGNAGPPSGQIVRLNNVLKYHRR